MNTERINTFDPDDLDPDDMFIELCSEITDGLPAQCFIPFTPFPCERIAKITLTWTAKCIDGEMTTSELHEQADIMREDIIVNCPTGLTSSWICGYSDPD